MTKRGDSPETLYGASARLVGLIDQFLDTPETREVAYYSMFHWHMAHSAERGIGTGAMNTVDVPPEVLKMVLNYDANLTTNEFFLQHYSVIKLLMAQDLIIINSMSMHVANATGENVERGKQIARDLAANRNNALTMLVLLHKGIEEAKQFDYKLREIVTLTDAEVAFFKQQGAY